MTACPGDNELAQLVDGTIADPARDRVERHLDNCHACAQLFAELAWIIAPLRPAPPGYRLVRALDDGTWEAIDTREERRVALAFGPQVDRARPCLPWRALARVEHPNVVAVYEVGELDGEPFVASELVTTTERAWRAAAPRTFDARLDVWRHALSGLAALHRAGITHPLSPEHVFVEDDRVLVGGFGKQIDRTSGFLAREVLEGQPATPLADQVPAAVSIFSALADRKPFAGATVGALVVAMSSPPDPPGFDRRLANVIARGLAADPADRWPNIDAFSAALARPPRNYTPYVLVTLVVVALVIAILAF